MRHRAEATGLQGLASLLTLLRPAENGKPNKSIKYITMIEFL
jgi:hypothetical protein